ncbi:DinB family protein [Nocardioides daphniae]|uniref:DinB family protein n=1 Tax=Nocardioides daphniae TaxID=402297 RepID=A0A4P7UF19_9ACTN|nr:DinB family protein [Nocardioides daphniae]QCC77459.1 DinB family protein [Nocardioides daphniae]GGD31834.1 methyltransferase type 12 [Nocardioides daphniae]
MADERPTPDPQAITPETKDWTWVLERPCEECGVASGDLEVPALAGLLHDSALEFGEALRAPDATQRPAPTTWSALEYACHVRDVHRTMAARLDLMLEQDDPVFDNWDQDETAVAERYWEQDPAVVDVELVEAAGHAAGLWASVTPEAYDRPGRRSNGSLFTVRTLGQYHLHDVLHHLHDVGRPVPRAQGDGR